MFDNFLILYLAEGNPSSPSHFMYMCTLVATVLADHFDVGQRPANIVATMVHIPIVNSPCLTYLLQLASSILLETHRLPLAAF